MSRSDTRLGDLCDVITKGTTPTTLGHDFTESGVPFLRVQNIESGRVVLDRSTLFISDDTHRFLSRSHICPGDILVSIAGTIGRAGIVPNSAPPLNCNQAVAIVRTKGHVYRPFLRHWLESAAVQSQMQGATVTGTISNLSLKQLGNLRISLPKFAEQRRIADILDKADVLRAKRRSVIVQLSTLTQSIFLDMLGDPATNPKAWPVVAMGDICEVKGGKRLPKGEEYSSTETPFRYIRVMDLKDGQVDETGLLHLKPETHAEIARYVVRAGDVIISIAGSIGLIAAVPASLDGVNLTENAAKLVPRGKGHYHADFLAAFLRTAHAQRQIDAHIGQATIGKLALFRIEKLQVPLPPLILQSTFASRMASVNAFRGLQDRGRRQLDILFASLQQRAFGGSS